MPTSWPASRRSRLRYRFGLCGATAQLVGFFCRGRDVFWKYRPRVGLRWGMPGHDWTARRHCPCWRATLRRLWKHVSFGDPVKQRNSGMRRASGRACQKRAGGTILTERRLHHRIDAIAAPQIRNDPVDRARLPCAAPSSHVDPSTPPKKFSLERTGGALSHSPVWCA